MPWPRSRPPQIAVAVAVLLDGTGRSHSWWIAAAGAIRSTVAAHPAGERRGRSPRSRRAGVGGRSSAARPRCARSGRTQVDLGGDAAGEFQGAADPRTAARTQVDVEPQPPRPYSRRRGRDVRLGGVPARTRRTRARSTRSGGSSRYRSVAVVTGALDDRWLSCVQVEFTGASAWRSAVRRVRLCERACTKPARCAASCTLSVNTRAFFSRRRGSCAEQVDSATDSMGGDGGAEEPDAVGWPARRAGVLARVGVGADRRSGRAAPPSSPTSAASGGIGRGDSSRERGDVEPCAIRRAPGSTRRLAGGGDQRAEADVARGVVGADVGSSDVEARPVGASVRPTRSARSAGSRRRAGTAAGASREVGRRAPSSDQRNAGEPRPPGPRG